MLFLQWLNFLNYLPIVIIPKVSYSHSSIQIIYELHAVRQLSEILICNLKILRVNEGKMVEQSRQDKCKAWLQPSWFWWSTSTLLTWLCFRDLFSHWRAVGSAEFRRTLSSKEKRHWGQQVPVSTTAAHVLRALIWSQRLILPSFQLIQWFAAFLKTCYINP